MSGSGLNVDVAVRERYSQAAKVREAVLCCPIDYDPRYLAIIPKDVIERDYGCGDPSSFVKAGETVLDLGSGSGKICFIAAQVVGPGGRVIGVDVNDEMLGLARRAGREVATKLGYDNTEFRKGRIQDLGLDRDQVDEYLRRRPITSEADLAAFEEHAALLRREQPLVADQSIDVVVSNCVLNLVSNQDKRQLFHELFRVLKRGGRAVISDIVADERVPEALVNDAELWSGCISGAFQEQEFLQAFESAGFYGVEIAKRDVEPWQTVAGIEFRSVTIVAYKGKEGACWDHHEALIYRGPFSAVTDDDGHTFERGERTAVCRKTFEIFSRAPYGDAFYPVKPLTEVEGGAAKPFVCVSGDQTRSLSDTKGKDYEATTTPKPAACGPPGCC